MKRTGFTMIELIFVIVILGILAAVAIPKLAATRTDAQVAKMSTNAATTLSDMGSYFTSQGTFGDYIDMTNAPLTTDAAGKTPIKAGDNGTAYLSDGKNGCVKFVQNSQADGNVTISTVVTGNICKGVNTKLTQTRVASVAGTEHDFGGLGVK
jgi:prepilin-type N-terminal cleavage/methylation domain-containing protein